MKIGKGILLLFLVIVACGKKQDKEKVGQNDLPAVVAEHGDGTVVDFKEIKGETVIVLFQTDCDHCQREATEIKNHMVEFKNYAIYFVTAGAWSDVEDFAKKYRLYDEPNVSFVVTSVDAIIKNFGSVPTPSIYVFDEKGKQKAKFNGETDIMKIVSSL